LCVVCGGVVGGAATAVAVAVAAVLSVIVVVPAWCCRRHRQLQLAAEGEIEKK